MNDSGSILNVSSGLTRYTFQGCAAYGSTKAAIDSLTRYMAAELASRKISVNAVAPGAIATEFGGALVQKDKEVNAALASQTALGRVGQADDIGNIMAVLLSEETLWINGQRVEASGGFRL